MQYCDEAGEAVPEGFKAMPCRGTSVFSGKPYDQVFFHSRSKHPGCIGVGDLKTFTGSSLTGSSFFEKYSDHNPLFFNIEIPLSDID